MPRVPSRLDGLSNCLTGLGDPEVDTRLATRRTWSYHPPVTELEQEWMQSWMAYVEVSTIPEAMFRSGFDIINIKPDTIDVGSLRSYMEGDLQPRPDGTLDLKRSLSYYAWKLREQGDKVGGAVLYPVLDDGLDPREPLDIRRIRRVVGWQVFDRGEITPWGGLRNLRPVYYVMSDVLAASGDTEYHLQPGDVIHASRVIVHEGRPGLSPREQRFRNWWGLSVLELNAPARKAAEYGAACARTYMDRVSWLHLSMAELNEMLAEKDDDGNDIGEAIVSARLRTIRKFAHLLGIVATDGGRQPDTASEVDQQIRGRNPDKLESVGESSGDLAKLVEMNWNEWSYGSRLPPSIAFGQTPSGLRGGDNEGDWQKFEGDVKLQQTTWGTWVINQMLMLEFAAKEGPTNGVIPEHWEIRWRPLRQSTALEIAAIAEAQARADRVRIESNVVEASEVRDQRLVRGDLDGPLRVEADVTDETAGVGPAQVGIATSALEGGIAVGEGRVSPKFLARWLTSIDEARYPPATAAQMAEDAASGRPTAAPTLPGAQPVPTEDALDPAIAEPKPEAFSTDPRPSDLHTPQDIRDLLATKWPAMQLHTRTITRMAEKHGLRKWPLAGKAGYSLADIEAVLSGEVEPPDADPPTDDQSSLSES